MRPRAQLLRFRLAALAVTVLSVAVPRASLAHAPDVPLEAMLHDAWSPQDGELQGAIDSVLLDEDGYLWLGTQLGLVRFNGADFHRIDRYGTPAMRTNSVFDLVQAPDGPLYAALNGGGVVALEGKSPARVSTVSGVSSDMVEDLDVGRDGALWVGSLAGLDRIHQGKAEAVHDSQGQPLGPVKQVLATRDGTAWVALRQGGLRAIEPGQTTAGDLVAPQSKVLSLIEQRKGGLLLGTDSGLLELTDGAVVSPWASDLPAGLAITCMLPGGHDELWLGTREDGLWRLSAWGAERFGREQGLTTDHVNALALDREGSLWIATHGGGLNRLREAAIASHPTNLPWVVYEDHDGHLWFGGSGGLSQMRDGRVVDFPGRQLLDDVVVGSLLHATDGSLWVGTLGDGLRQLDGGRVVRSLDSTADFPSDRVLALTQDAAGALWAGTERGVVRLQDDEVTLWGESAGLTVPTVRALHFVQSGDLWACTDGDGCFVRRGEGFEPVPGSDSPSPAQRFVNGLHEDGQGTVWLATDGGLLRWRDGHFHAFTTEHGLPQDVGYRILEDDDANLWLSCDLGVYRVAKAQLDAVAAGKNERVEGVLFGRAQGMRWPECNGGSHPAGWRASDGVLWFPTTGGLVSIDPDRLKPNRVPPPVHIEGLVVDGTRVSIDQPGSFPPGSQSFVFQYAALTFVGPHQVRYRVMLEGLDRGWVDKGNVRSKTYHPLPPGQYTFRVIAANSDGTWNETGDSYSFVVHPAFHQRRDVRIVAALLLLLGGLGLPLLRIRRLVRHKEQLEVAVASRTAELRELSLRDPLTGLRNRRFLWEVKANAAAGSAAGGQDSGERRKADRTGTTGFLMIDLDHFKQVNDDHGHPTGDAVLRQVARLLEGAVRRDDIVVRWGGEEFLLVLEHTQPAALALFAERLRSAVAELRFETPGGDVLRKTCSVGVCHHPFFGGGSEQLDLEQVIAVADAALYRAKNSGRDRVVQVLPGDHVPTDAADRHLVATDLDAAVARGLVRLEG